MIRSNYLGSKKSMIAIKVDNWLSEGYRVVLSLDRGKNEQNQSILQVCFLQDEREL